jgi:two-component system, OmpR family, sensor kinase
MKKSSSKFAVISIIVTTVLSTLIGGYATLAARASDLEQIDESLQKVVTRVNAFPSEAISAAILTIEDESLDLTLSLVTQEGDETIINESDLDYPGLSDLTLVRTGLAGATTNDSPVPFRFQSAAIVGGDYLVIASSLDKLNENFISNLKSLGLFTAVADALAIFFSIYFLRRHNQGLDAQALQRMQRFLSDASHELRTPLTVIKGYNEMLSKGQFTQAPDQARAFSRVSSEIERMESLIHDLLLLAELGESKPVDFDELDFDELVKSHLNDFQVLNKSREVTTSIPSDCFVSGSREHLNRLIQNCLSNIVRHTPSDAPVSVSLRNIGKRAELKIEDGGPGLPESAYGSEIKAMNRFDPSRSRESGGSGLGLSIIAAIVQEHNGELELSKSQLGGLAVTIRIPN